MPSTIFIQINTKLRNIIVYDAFWRIFDIFYEN